MAQNLNQPCCGRCDVYRKMYYLKLFDTHTQHNYTTQPTDDDTKNKTRRLQQTNYIYIHVHIGFINSSYISLRALMVQLCVCFFFLALFIFAGPVQQQLYLRLCNEQQCPLHSLTLQFLCYFYFCLSYLVNKRPTISTLVHILQ